MSFAKHFAHGSQRSGQGASLIVDGASVLSQMVTQQFSMCTVHTIGSQVSQHSSLQTVACDLVDLRSRKNLPSIRRSLAVTSEVATLVCTSRPQVASDGITTKDLSSHRDSADGKSFSPRDFLLYVNAWNQSKPSIPSQGTTHGKKVDCFSFALAVLTRIKFPSTNAPRTDKLTIRCISETRSRP